MCAKSLKVLHVHHLFRKKSVRKTTVHNRSRSFERGWYTCNTFKGLEGVSATPPRHEGWSARLRRARGGQLLP